MSIPGYITAKEYADRLGVTVRRVRALILNGRIGGAIKMCGAWFIPDKTNDVRDKRYLRS